MARPPVYRRDYYGTRRPLLLNKTHAETERDRGNITVSENTFALRNYQDSRSARKSSTPESEYLRIKRD